MTRLTPNQHAALAYYEREASGTPHPEGEVLGGLTIPEFRIARSRLVAAGALIRDKGRYKLPPLTPPVTT